MKIKLSQLKQLIREQFEQPDYPKHRKQSEKLDLLSRELEDMAGSFSENGDPESQEIASALWDTVAELTQIHSKMRNIK